MYNAAAQTLDLAYDDNLTSSPSLTGVDNITGSTGGDLFVAEDGGNLETNIIARPTTSAPAGRRRLRRHHLRGHRTVPGLNRLPTRHGWRMR